MLGISISVSEGDVAETWDKIKSFYVGGAEEIKIDDPNNVQGIINVRKPDTAAFLGTPLSTEIFSSLETDRLCMESTRAPFCTPQLVINPSGSTILPTKAGTLTATTSRELLKTSILTGVPAIVTISCICSKLLPFSPI